MRVLPAQLFGLMAWLWRQRGMPPDLQKVADNARASLPYFTANPKFDVSGTERALAETAIEVPPLNDYADRLFQSCLANGWGENSPILAGRAHRRWLTKSKA